MSDSAPPPNLKPLLRAVLARVLDGFTDLIRVDRLSGGASQETYRIEVAVGSVTRLLALRRAPHGSRGARQPGLAGLTTEAQLLRAARQAGVPVPDVVATLAPEDGLGAGFFMEWLEGETLGKRISTAKALTNARVKLAFEAGATLARIHAIDLDATDLRARLSTLSPEALIQQTWAQYQALHTAQPMLDYVARWLLEHQPAASASTLVHADFRNGNLMVGPQGLVAVLDWELAHIGDPMRDLGWICTASWRFGRPELAVGGFGTRAQLFEGYASVSGQPVDPDHVRFWEVFGSFWWSVICLSMAAQYRTGQDRTLERAAVGRRASEGQIDCVNLLLPGPVKAPDSEQLNIAADLPHADELLEAVTDFLQHDATAGLSGRPKFLARVAANAIEIVRREACLQPVTATAEHARLSDLLGRHEPLPRLRQALAEALRNQTIPLDDPQLVEHLRQTVVDQVAIDQPSYAGLKSALTT